MINFHDLDVKFSSKAHNECLRQAQMLCNYVISHLTPTKYNFWSYMSKT